MNVDQINILSQTTVRAKPKAIHAGRFPIEVPESVILPCGLIWGAMVMYPPYGDGDQRDGTVYVTGTNKMSWTIPFHLSVDRLSPETFLPDGIEETVVKEITAFVATVIEEHEVMIPMQGEHDYERPKVVSVDFIPGDVAASHVLLDRLVNQVYFVDYDPSHIGFFDPDKTPEPS